MAGARRVDEQRGGRVDLTWVQTPIGLAFCAAWNLLVVLLMVLVARNFPSVPGAAAIASPETTLGAGPGLGGHP